MEITNLNYSLRFIKSNRKRISIRSNYFIFGSIYRCL